MADLDGNGKDEILVAAPFADGPNNFRPEAGETYVIYDDDTTVVVVGVPDRPVPAVATLYPNYPNPFNPATTFRFAAPIGSVTSLSIYDVYGREIAVPVQSEVMHCEVREVQWSARDDEGDPLPSGVYFVRLRVGNEVHSRKITIVR